jgi:Spy/CpxP family protein refolding chaperone
MATTPSRVVIVALALGLMAAATGTVSAQGRRGGRGGQPVNLGPDIRSRMELLTDALSLTDDQKDDVKTRMDTAHKAAAPIRAELARTRAALAAAAANAGGGSEITSAADAYAVAATTMTELEMRTLADILSVVTPEQKKQGTVAAFYLMRGIFLDEKKWNDTPNGRLY